MGDVLKDPESPPADSRKWIGRIVIAVVLGEAIWGFLVSITNYLALPAMAKIIGGDPQSSQYVGKGDFNVTALFISFLELCLAGIVAVLLNSWTQKSGSGRARSSQPVRRAPVTAPRPASVVVPPADPPPAPAVDAAIQANASVTSMQSASRPAQPLQQVAKPAKPKPPKQVYYNIVGERVEADEE